MIIKVRNKPGFAQIQNETLRDKRLSLEARGALGEILTYSENFDVDVKGLMTLWDIGREKLLKITNELKENGYLEITDVRDKKCKIIDKEWNFFGVSQGVNFREKAIKQTVENENPLSVQSTENPHAGETAVQDTALPYVGENQSLEKPHHLLKEELREKDEEKESEIKKSGGGGLNANPPARSGNVKPPPPEFPPGEESRADYLLRKQIEYPHFDVQKIYEDFRRKCGSVKYPKLKDTRRSFDRWLETQDVEFADAQAGNPAFNEADYFKRKYGEKKDAA